MPNTPRFTETRRKAIREAQRETDAYYRSYEAKLDFLLEEVEADTATAFALLGRTDPDY